MALDLRFDQGDTGATNRARTDLALDVEIDIVATAVTGTAVFDLLSKPSDSTAVITGTGNTRQITLDAPGQHRVRVTDDDVSVPPRIYTIGAVTENLGLVIPAPGERADPNANDVDTDPGDWVDRSETNVGASFQGWHDGQAANLKKLDAMALYIATMTSTGIIEGGRVTVNVDTSKFDVAEGIAQHKDPNDASAQPTTVKFPAFIAQDPLDLATTAFTTLSISPAGALVQSNDQGTPLSRRSNAELQNVNHSDFATVTVDATSNQPAAGVVQAILDYIKLLGAINTGNQYTAAAADLTISKSVGTTNLPFLNGAFSEINPNEQANPAADPTGFLQVYIDSGFPGGFNLSAQTDVPVGSWDDGSDTLATVGMNNWAIYWVDFFNNGTAITIGQAEYNTLDDAKSAIFTENPITAPAIAGVPNTRRTAIIAKGNATDLSNLAQAEFIPIQMGVTGSSSPVISVFGRTGVVSAEAGDYASFLVSYDNTTSGLTATDVKAALDELAALPAEGLQANYNAGRFITTSTGALVFQNIGDTNTVLSLSRTFAAAGNILEVNLGLGGQAVTGRGISAASGTGATGPLVRADNQGTGDALAILDGGAMALQVTGGGAHHVTPPAGEDATVTTTAAGSFDVNGATIDSAGVLDMNAKAITDAVTVNGVPLSAAGADDDFLNEAGAYIPADDLVAGAALLVNTQTGTTYTLLAADNGKLVTLDNAGAITVDLDTGLPAGFHCALAQLGAGQVTIAGTATLNHKDSHDKTEKQFALVAIAPTNATDVYLLGGATAA